MSEQVLFLQRDAPAKPLPGEPCNGCGVCCAAETCPAGRLLSRQKLGPCPALLWQAAEGRYRCNLLLNPAQHLRFLPNWMQGWARRAFRRWIAAGHGCDSSLEILSPTAPAPSDRNRN